MTIPHILALDFDGVLCDGMREYFEASRRTYRRVWPDEPARSASCRGSPIAKRVRARPFP